MQYKEMIRKLFSFSAKGMSTFDIFCNLDQQLGQPHRSFRSIHIAGTNGKGSTATKIARALQEDGWRVGLFTSPHISSVRERIQINGQMISEEAMCVHLSSLFSMLEQPLSFFDFLSALAFLYFKEQSVDWAVIEVGLGGRLDATNVIHPMLSVITSIGYDHMEILGDTLEKIAFEKGGICKAWVPVIAGPSAAPFFPFAEAVKTCSSFYDMENSAIARAALQKLGVSETSIEKGLKIRPCCRFEQLGGSILDAAHNPDGFQKLVQALRYHFPKELFHFIVAFSQGKQWRKCLDLIEPIAEKISFVNTNPRFVPLGGGTFLEAISASQARKVVCGSFYHLAEARRLFGIVEPCDPQQ